MVNIPFYCFCFSVYVDARVFMYVFMTLYHYDTDSHRIAFTVLLGKNNNDKLTHCQLQKNNSYVTANCVDWWQTARPNLSVHWTSGGHVSGAVFQIPKLREAILETLTHQ